jgi:hypothetical protein
VPVVLEPHEDQPEAEGILQEKGIVDGLGGRPEEEDERDRDLRRQEHVGQQLAIEDHAPVHGASMRPARVPVFI